MVKLLAPVSSAPVRSIWAASVLRFSLEWRGLPGPSGSSDHAAEIAADEVRILVREHVGLDVAEGRLRLVLDAVVEGLEDVLLKMPSTRMRMNHSLALRVAVFGIGQAEDIHLDAGGYQGDDRVHVLRDARRRVQGDRGPDRVDILLHDAVASEEVTGRIRAVDLESLGLTAVLMGQ